MYSFGVVVLEIITRSHPGTSYRYSHLLDAREVKCWMNCWTHPPTSHKTTRTWHNSCFEQSIRVSVLQSQIPAIYAYFISSVFTNSKDLDYKIFIYHFSWRSLLILFILPGLQSNRFPIRNKSSQNKGSHILLKCMSVYIMRPRLFVSLFVSLYG